MADETPKVVPKRADFKKEPVFVKATIADQAGTRPGYVRQWFHRSDPKSRGFFERYQVEQYIGDPDIGYCKAEPWTVVEARSAKPGRKRDDDGKGVETAQTHGDLILMETTVENAAIYSTYDKLKSQSRERALRAGEKDTTVAENGGRATYRARVGAGTVADDPRAVLDQ